MKKGEKDEGVELGTVLGENENERRGWVQSRGRHVPAGIV
jgi:hypothetical protein